MPLINGKKVFDFGRSTEGEGHFVSRSSGGHNQYPCVGICIKWMILKKRFLREVDQSALRTTIETMWQKMPLGVAN